MHIVIEYDWIEYRISYLRGANPINDSCVTAQPMNKL